MLHACRNAHGGQFEHLLWLSCLSCQVLLVFLTLFFFNFSEFHVDSVNDCLYCISCVVCYKVEELRSRYDAKLQHAFLTFSSYVLLQKCENWAWERKKLCGNKSSISCQTRGNRQGSVGTNISCGGQYISHIVGNVFRCHCAKKYRNWLTFE